MFKNIIMALSLALNAALAIVASFGIGYICGGVADSDTALVKSLKDDLPK